MRAAGDIAAARTRTTKAERTEQLRGDEKNVAV